VLGASALLDLVLFGGSLLNTESVRGFVSSGSLPSWPDAVTSLLIALGIAVAVEAISSTFVNVNRFSLHALYRNRLVRAFLGASNPARSANLFTEFDEHDNVQMHTLWPGRRAEGWQPFHVINMALNIVSTKNLAWQERKAESFTVSPLHSAAPARLIGAAVNTAMSNEASHSAPRWRSRVRPRARTWAIIPLRP
jgi:hypothetical protein